MLARVFDIDNGKVIIDPNVLLIPEFKAIHKKYKKDSINPLSYVYYMCDPRSPYSNLPEDSKEQRILQDFPGDYTPEDKEIIAAVKKAEELYETPTSRYFKSLKVLQDKFAQYYTETDIVDGRDGNITALQNALKGAGKLAMEVKMVGKLVDEEIASAVGDRTLGYDEI